MAASQSRSTCTYTYSMAQPSKRAGEGYRAVYNRILLDSTVDGSGRGDARVTADAIRLLGGGRRGNK